MFTRVIAVAFALILSSLSAQEYRPDILGEGFVQQQLDMGCDYSGRVVATVVRTRELPASERAVLYIHGFNDYFFQSEMAERFAAEGFRFYALDLRKYGRSILPENRLFELRDIAEYDAEITRTLEIIRSEGATDITLMGHSTGGLIATLYAHNHRGSVDRLILNSPFFDMNNTPLLDNIIIPVVAAIAKVVPRMNIPMGSSTAYGESLHRDFHGEWRFDTSLKLSPSPTMEASWLRAIYNAQKEMKRIRDLNIPILLMYSDKSMQTTKWSVQCQQADTVLDVEDIKLYGEQLGTRVKQVEVKDGMHDLVLSQLSSRENAYLSIFSWLCSEF